MDQVASAIAVIGVYVALMAVLSVSVEAVIGWFKIPITWLQGKPSPADVLAEVKDWLPQQEDSANWEARVAALNKALDAIGETRIDYKKETTLAEIATRVGEATTKHVKRERDRRGVIRLIAVVVGFLFAALFQIDTLQLLAPLSLPAQELWLRTLGPDGAHIAGLALSGLAASAGSGFWHDQSARLRTLKGIAESTGGGAGSAA
jgi:hypothetical protein